MLTLSSPVKLRHKATVIALLVPLALTACTSDKGPTAAQAGQTLKNHILQLLKERSAEDVTVTDPGGKNIPCAEGKAKQTFAVTGKDLPQRKSDALVDALLGALKRVAPYDIVSTGDPGQPVHVQNKAAGTVLTLSSPGNGEYAVNGETLCLLVG